MEWISVKDRMPETREPFEDAGYSVSQRVLATDGDFVFSASLAQTVKTKRWRWRGEYGVMNVTHWMPLPEPPKRGPEPA